MRKLLFILGIALILSSCYYDSEEALFPTLAGTCDTTLVSFTADIVPVLNDNCLLCHSNLAAPSLGNNIKLEDFSDVAASSDMVLGSVKHEAGYSPMPKGGGNLGSCQLLKLEAWISQGKNDN